MSLGIYRVVDGVLVYSNLKGRGNIGLCGILLRFGFGHLSKAMRAANGACASMGLVRP